MQKSSYKTKQANNTLEKINKNKKLSNLDEFDDPTPQKMDLRKVEKTNKPEKINLYELGDDQKNLRQKAFQLMKKRVLNKEDLNKLSKMNFDNEPLNRKIQETVFIQGDNDQKENGHKKIEEVKTNNSSMI